jgi:1-deoxy-D-xylulose-5-phosphate reductoisomerase
MKIGVTVLGSTGSVGINTLDVISRHPDRFSVTALSANRNVAVMTEQCLQFHPEVAVMVDPDCATELQQELSRQGSETRVLAGDPGLLEISAGDAQTIVCSIVGAAGLMSVIAAVDAGKRVLIANKEPLVMMGEHIVSQARRSGACLLPLDSEHNAIFQCMPQQSVLEHKGSVQVSDDQGIRKILLTGSGGPFRTLPADQLAAVTPEQACAHPNWKMGRKISVDSATMMNKGLELIEACALFGVDAGFIEIVVHPQSIIHSMVEYIDGSIIAQLGSPDMRVPISNALAWPDRIESGASHLDFRDLARFDFEPPDMQKFPALGLAQIAAEQGGTLPAIMNAANEIAVRAFLDGEISFDRITVLVEKTMQAMNVSETANLDSVLEADRGSRVYCRELLLGSGN